MIWLKLIYPNIDDVVFTLDDHKQETPELSEEQHQGEQQSMDWSLRKRAGQISAALCQFHLSQDSCLSSCLRCQQCQCLRLLLQYFTTVYLLFNQFSFYELVIQRIYLLSGLDGFEIILTLISPKQMLRILSMVSGQLLAIF